MLVKDRCVGVLDLESPELDAFNKQRRRDPHAAGEPGRRGHRERAALRGGPVERGAHRAGADASRRRVQAALLPTSACPSACVASTWPRVSPRRASSGATCTISCRRRHTAWWSPWATCRARACPRRSTARSPASSCDRARSAAATRPSGRRPAGVLASMNTILHERAARGVLLHAHLRALRSEAADASRWPTRRCRTRIRCSAGTCEQIDLPGIPLGSFAGRGVRRADLRLRRRATSSCSAPTACRRRSQRVGRGVRDRSADRGGEGAARSRRRAEIVDAIFDAVESFRGERGAERRHDRGRGQVYGVTCSYGSLGPRSMGCTFQVPVAVRVFAWFHGMPPPEPEPEPGTRPEPNLNEPEPGTEPSLIPAARGGSAPQVQADGAAAEGAELRHLARDAHARAARRHAADRRRRR